MSNNATPGFWQALKPDAEMNFLCPTCQEGVIATASDRIFDAAFEVSEAELPEFLQGEAYTAEMVAAGALRVVADILAGLVSPYPSVQRVARSRLDQLLAKESS